MPFPKAVTKFLLIIVLIIWVSISYSQDYSYTKYTTENGLPSNEVYYILEDSKGYIWFATDNGVSCYNGYEFKNCGLNQGMPCNTILSLYEDYKGRVWCVCRNSDLAFIANDTLFSYVHNDVLDRCIKKKNRILNNSIYVDSMETLHIGTLNQGFFEIDSTGEIKNDLGEASFNIKEFDGVYLYSSSAVHGERKNILWENSYGRITKEIDYYIGNARIYSFKINPDEAILSNGFSLVKMSRDTGLVYPLKNAAWLGYVSGNLWISEYNNGVKCFTNGNLQAQPLHYLKEETVTSVVELESGVVWMSTLDGVYKFYNLAISNASSKKETSNKIVDIELGGNGELWYVTDKGDIAILHDKSETDFSEINKEIVLSMCFNKDIDRMCMSIGGAYTFYSLSVEGDIKKYEYNKCEKRKYIPFIKDMLFKEDSEFYYCGNAVGILRLRKDSFGLEEFKDIEIMKEQRGICIEKFSKDSPLLIGTKQGLLSYSFKEDSLSQIAKELIKASIVDIECDLEANVWAASKEKGIFYLCNDSVYQISTEDGLSSNSVNTLWVDSNIVWAGTVNGLNKITIICAETKEIRIDKMYKWHGLVSNVINDIVLNNDTLYVGTDRGLSFFNISNFTLNQKAPPIYISNISIEEKDTLVQDAYKLDYNQNNIAISYVGINYRTGNKTWYKYRLVGADKNWVETQNRIVRYSSLQPGEYRFEVVAQNENGIWGIEPAQVSIIIDKPYWQTWWFMAFIFLFVAGIAVLVILIIFRVKIKESKKRNLLHNNLNKLKQEALAQQMNPHFIFNTLSSIQYYINENEKSASNKYLTMFSNLMRMTLNNSHKKNITIREEIEALEIYIQLEQLRFEDKFDYKIDIDPQLDIEKILIPSLMLQPFVENAIWHGIMHKDTNDGLVEVAISQDKDLIKLVIQDNGVGRKKSSEINAQRSKTHKSLGSKITESRLRLISTLYGGALSIKYIDLQDINEDNCGTQVEITLPLIYS